MTTRPSRLAPPRIGLTLDAENPGGYSAYPWYALRANYAQAIAEAGGLPLPLPHLPALAEAMLDSIDALIVTGGAFDVSPALYGDGDQHETVTLKHGRTEAELACCAERSRAACRFWGSAAASSSLPWCWAAR